MNDQKKQKTVDSKRPANSELSLGELKKVVAASGGNGERRPDASDPLLSVGPEILQQGATPAAPLVPAANAPAPEAGDDGPDSPDWKSSLADSAAQAVAGPTLAEVQKMIEDPKSWGVNADPAKPVQQSDAFRSSSFLNGFGDDPTPTMSELLNPTDDQVKDMMKTVVGNADAAMQELKALGEKLKQEAGLLKAQMDRNPADVQEYRTAYEVATKVHAYVEQAFKHAEAQKSDPEQQARKMLLAANQGFFANGFVTDDELVPQSHAAKTFDPVKFQAAVGVIDKNKINVFVAKYLANKAAQEDEWGGYKVMEGPDGKVVGKVIGKNTLISTGGIPFKGQSIEVALKNAFVDSFNRPLSAGKLHIAGPAYQVTSQIWEVKEVKGVAKYTVLSTTKQLVKAGGLNLETNLGFGGQVGKSLLAPTDSMPAPGGPDGAAPKAPATTGIDIKLDKVKATIAKDKLQHEKQDVLWQKPPEERPRAPSVGAAPKTDATKAIEKLPARTLEQGDRPAAGSVPIKDPSFAHAPKAIDVKVKISTLAGNEKELWKSADGNTKVTRTTSVEVFGSAGAAQKDFTNSGVLKAGLAGSVTYAASSNLSDNTVIKADVEGKIEGVAFADSAKGFGAKLGAEITATAQIQHTLQVSDVHSLVAKATYVSKAALGGELSYVQGKLTGKLEAGITSTADIGGEAREGLHAVGFAVGVAAGAGAGVKADASVEDGVFKIALGFKLAAGGGTTASANLAVDFKDGARIVERLAKEAQDPRTPLSQVLAEVPTAAEKMAVFMQVVGHELDEEAGKRLFTGSALAGGALVAKTLGEAQQKHGVVLGSLITGIKGTLVAAGPYNPVLGFISSFV